MLLADDAVPMLPTPPWLERVLFEQPLPGVLFLAAAAIVAFVVLNRSGRGGAALAAVALGVFLSGVLLLLALTVKTEREGLLERTREAVGAVFAGDDTATGRLLSDAVRLSLVGRATNYGKPEMLRHIKGGTLKAYGVKGFTLGAERATLDGPDLARTQVRVKVDTEWSGAPVGSWWVLTWRRVGDGASAGGEWVITSIEAQQIDFVRYGEPIDLK